MAQQNEVNGVVGYISDNLVYQLTQQSGTTVDLRFELGNDNIMMRVKTDDIVQVIPGKSEKGETLVQVILKPGSVIETAIKAFRDVKAIDDPTLTRLTSSALVSVSFV